MKNLVLQKTGLYRESEPGEAATAVFLKKYEYDHLTDFRDLDLKTRFLKDNACGSVWKEDDLTKEIKVAEAQLEALQEEVEEKAAAMRELKDEVDNARAENANLIRMVKEKANQNRDLRPKKGHPGYVVTRQDEETNVVGHDGFGNQIDLHGWRTTIETPYDIDIPVELIEEVVRRELSQALRGNIEIHKGRYADVPEATREGNVVYNYDFHANANDKNHLWTVCLHSIHQVEIEDGKKEVEDEDGKEEVGDGKDDE